MYVFPAKTSASFWAECYRPLADQRTTIPNPHTHSYNPTRILCLHGQPTPAWPYVCMYAPCVPSFPATGHQYKWRRRRRRRHCCCAEFGAGHWRDLLRQRQHSIRLGGRSVALLLLLHLVMGCGQVESIVRKRSDGIHSLRQISQQRRTR